MRRELSEGYNRGVSNQWYAVSVCYGCQSRQVSHLQLRICYNLQKYAACIVIDISLYFLQVEQVARPCLNAKPREA